MDTEAAALTVGGVGFRGFSASALSDSTIRSLNPAATAIISSHWICCDDAGLHGGGGGYCCGGGHEDALPKTKNGENMRRAIKGRYLGAPVGDLTALDPATLLEVIPRKHGVLVTELFRGDHAHRCWPNG